jgi:hypothetical protein
METLINYITLVSVSLLICVRKRKMSGYEIMAIVGGIIWAVFTAIYALRFKKGIRARKWYGVIAYTGLAFLLGGVLQIFKPELDKHSPILVFGILAVFIYLTAKVYIFNNVES